MGKRLVPSLEQWKGYRAIVQHWDLTMRRCCEQDLPKKEFEELEKAILSGDSMDALILLVAKRFPKLFHVGMIPDFRKEIQADQEVSEATREEMEAEQAKWEAELRLFKCGLSSDWRLIDRTRIGSAALRDILDWHDSAHIREQGLIARCLVQHFMNTNVPLATATSWADVPGAIPHNNASGACSGWQS